MRKLTSSIVVVLVLSSILSMVFCTNSVGARMLIDPPTTETTVQIVDFNNGTREMITDYQNGTRNCLAETFVKNTAELLTAQPNETHQSLTSIVSEAVSSRGRESNEETTDYVNATQTVVFSQPMMLGFTYTLGYWQERLISGGRWWIFSWYFAVGVDIDIQFGIRLPLNITIEYPEHTSIGNNYTIHATLDPIDKPDFDELLITCKANIWAEANILGVIGFARTVLVGPDFDYSQSFTTPLGSETAPLLSLSLRIDLFEIIKMVDPSLKPLIDIMSNLVNPFLMVYPTFGSDRITAKADCSGDLRVSGASDLNWSDPGQTVDFIVNADEYDNSTNFGSIVLSDFRYYFTKFSANFELLFDLNDWINGWPLNIHDPILHICTLDLSWIIEIIGNPSVSSHAGYPDSVSFPVYVERMLNPSPSQPLVDIGLSYAYLSPSKAHVGETVNVAVGATNVGNTSEAFVVTVYANNLAIGNWSIAGLEPGNVTDLELGWNTAGYSPGSYNITAQADILANELNTGNNVLSVGTVEISFVPPVATFTFSPTAPIINETVTFDATNSTSGSGDIVNYIWDFGDDSELVSTHSIVTHVFADGGLFSVNLTVVNSEGLNNTAWVLVNVYQFGGHDVAVVDVAPETNWIHQGNLLNITVTVANKGNSTESVEVRLYYNLTANKEIGTKSIDLGANETGTLIFTWNTSQVQFCHNYTITAAAGIESDINPEDNIYENWVKVRMMGDVNGDGRVDMRDISDSIVAFNSFLGYPRWNAQADLNQDGRINTRDILLIATHFGIC